MSLGEERRRYTPEEIRDLVAQWFERAQEAVLGRDGAGIMAGFQPEFVLVFTNPEGGVNRIGSFDMHGQPERTQLLLTRALRQPDVVHEFSALEPRTAGGAG